MPSPHLSVSSSFLPLLVLGIAAYTATPAGASVGFQPVLPQELSMTSEPLAPGARAIVLDRRVDRYDAGRTPHEDNYFRIKILTEEGRKYADIEIPFVKRHQNVVNIKARTIRLDGSTVNFDGKIFEKTIVKAKGLKYLAKTFTLPEVQTGSIIEYYYTIDFSENYVFESHWILSGELFTKKASFSLKPYYSDYSSINVRWSWHALPAGTLEPKEGPDHVVRLEAANIPAFQTEDFMPPENEMKSRVDFVYDDERFEREPDKFWKRTGKKLNAQLESFVGRSRAMEQAVAQIVSANDAPEAKLQKIYTRVQQLRNSSYEVRKTEQEEKRAKEKDAGNVEDVWKLGYGDGRQLTWLYLALVRAAGFEAYGVWVSDRRNYFFVPNLMDKSKLSGNVVLVKLNGKDLYCDPGAAFTPFGFLPWPETGVHGLRLDRDGGTWVQTTLPESSASRIERSAKLKLSAETGGLEGKLALTFTGLQAMQRRLENRNVDEAERKKFLEEEVKEYIPVASDVELANKPDWSSSTQPLLAEFELKIPGWAAAAGRRALVPVGIFSAAQKHLFDHASRVHPIYFEFPFQESDDISIELPAGWQVTSLPKPRNEDARAALYTLNVDNDKGTLRLTRKLNIDILLLDAKYYPALRNFFQVVRTGDEQQIVTQPGAAAAGQ